MVGSAVDTIVWSSEASSIASSSPEKVRITCRRFNEVESVTAASLVYSD